MKKLFYKIGAVISFSVVALVPVSVFAQLSQAQQDLSSIGSELGGSPTNLPELVGKLINIFLSVLGIFFVVLVVYAGYLWMTDMGEGKKVEKAKTLLGQAIIGIVITLSAYAISSFVIERIVTGTT